MDLAQDVERRRRFERLVTEVYAPVQRYLLRRTDPTGADDVLGDVLLVLWRRLDDAAIRSGRCPGRTASRADAWPTISAARRGRSAWCTASPRSGRAQDAADDGRLQRALEALPEADQEVLRLWAWEQLPPREIALAMGLTANAVSLRLHRAKRRLKKALTSGKETGPAGHMGMRDGGGARR